MGFVNTLLGNTFQLVEIIGELFSPLKRRYGIEKTEYDSGFWQGRN